MRFPYPLDNCECGHYRTSHNAKTGMGETTCNACICHQFSLKLPEDERSKVHPGLKDKPETYDFKQRPFNVQSANK